MQMTQSKRDKVLVLCWASPWPALGGGALRALGLLQELATFCQVELLIASKKELEPAQTRELLRYADTVTRVPLRTSTTAQRLRILLRMMTARVPYHCAVLRESFRERDELYYMREFPGVVYANMGQWGTLLDSRNTSWILDQQNADVQFWRAYLAYSTGLRKAASWINWKLAARHYPEIYARVGRVVSVSEQDRDQTLAITPSATVDVIENGVDCSYLTPGSRLAPHPSRFVFTGTSAVRNVKALADFCRDVWPRILAAKPKAEICVAGDFSAKAQEQFANVQGIQFTGRVEDIRPYFDPGDIFVAPFRETHGSKLKVAEAMAMGMAIVSSPQGAQGFPAQHGVNALIASDPASFAACCIELLDSPELVGRLGKAARLTAEKELDWPVLGLRLRPIIEQTWQHMEPPA